MPRILLALALFALTLWVADAHAQNLNAAGQSIMDMVLSVLRQLMNLVVEFIRLVLAEIVNAIRSLLPSFGLGK